VPTRTVHPDRPAGAPLTTITPLTPRLILGAKADPYSPAESTQRFTQRTLRRLLERFAGDPREIGTISTISGMEISILTRSPLLLRDLDLLVDLDRRHAVTVSVLIPAVEADLARRIESTAAAPDRSFQSTPSSSAASMAAPGPPPPSPPSPDARFELVHALAAHGIATRVLCTPVQPGLNNSVAVLRRLLARAHEAGAFDVSPAPRHPALRPTSAESRQLLALFHRLRLERGFPRTSPGRA
jgi:DNA repair photolyase